MSSYTEGQTHQLMEALQTAGFTADDVTKLGQFDNLPSIRAVVRNELVVSAPIRHWTVDKDGTIRFSVTSDGTTGPEWADWFKTNGYNLGSEAEFILRSSSFRPSVKGTTYEIAVLKGDLFTDQNRTTSNLRAKADSLGFKQGKEVNPEIACLIRRMFSDEEIEAMGLWRIVTLHQPIGGSGGGPGLLGADRGGSGRWLGAYYGEPVDRWRRDLGFACVVSPACNA
jgi:hypothetical protein